MATSLGKVGIVDKGNYLQEETYNAGDFVLYNGSTWLALKDGILGVEPAEGTNWKYLARGFEAEVLSMIAANDTSGLIGEAGQQVNAQSLIDVIADKVATKLIEKGSIVNNAVTTVEGTVLDGRMGKALQDQITDVNNNIEAHLLDEATLLLTKNNKKTFLYQNPNFGTVISNLDGITKQQSDLAITPNEIRFLRYNEEGVNIENSKLVTNSDLANLSASINNTLSFEVVGKMVFINGYVTGLSITSEGVNIGSLPSGVPIPKNTIRENCNVGTNAYDVGSQGYFTISDTGTITVKCASGKTASAFYVSCSYVGK